MVSLKTLTYSVTWAVMDNDNLAKENNASKCPSYSEEFKESLRTALYIKGIVQGGPSGRIVGFRVGRILDGSIVKIAIHKLLESTQRLDCIMSNKFPLPRLRSQFSAEKQERSSMYDCRANRKRELANLTTSIHTINL